MSIGFVYILGNEYMPDLYKIGCTERSPRARADEISNATGVPVSFHVLCYAEFPNFQAIERRIHQWLNGYRVNQAREFFHGCLPQAVSFLWYHPDRIAFTDAMAGTGSPFDSELVCQACAEKHENYLDDLPNPWKSNDPIERERIERLKRYADGNFDSPDEIANVVPALDSPADGETPVEASSEAETTLRLVAGGAA